MQEDQEELAAVEAEARQVLSAAQQELAEAQEALAVTSDKVARHWAQHGLGRRFGMGLRTGD